MKNVKMNLDDFISKYMSKPVESENDDGLAEYLNEIQIDFDVSFKCRKCGSSNVVVIGEKGTDYGGYTGYSVGSNVVKCKSCGNAVTIWI